MRISSTLKRRRANGFTLIEMSIVLVIIGLIVGGVLVGQDLIRAAYIRAQITQIEKYNTAVNTFRGKYGYLPGDINATAASQFGFITRGLYAGEGDGNGVIEGVICNAANCNVGYASFGETTLFWVDLSTAGLINESFNTVTATTLNWPAPASFSLYFPQAKIGNGAYVDVFSGGPGTCFDCNPISNSINYFSIGLPICIGCGSPSLFSGTAKGFSVAQAYRIDQKIDDSLPGTGRVTAMSNMLSCGTAWANCTNPQSSNTPSATTCYDGASIITGPTEYSMSQNNGNGVNCALAFQFQ